MVKPSSSTVAYLTYYELEDGKIELEEGLSVVMHLYKKDFHGSFRTIRISERILIPFWLNLHTYCE